MSDKDIESEIQAKGLTAPRPTVSKALLLRRRISQDGAWRSHKSKTYWRRGKHQPHESLSLLTFCVMVLRNGFTVTGESAAPARKTSTLRLDVRLPVKMR
jgi:hypothetical protein